MALTDAQLKAYVRSKGKFSIGELPDAQILYFAGRGSDTSDTDNVDALGNLDVAGVIGDCWLWLASDDRYGSETQGAVSVSQPQARWWATFWYGQSNRLDMTAPSITQGVTTREDLMASGIGDDEHGVLFI